MSKDKNDISDDGHSPAYHRQYHTDHYQAGIGLKIAALLGLSQDRDGRYSTAYGTKTPLGLYLSVQRIIADIDEHGKDSTIGRDKETSDPCESCRKLGTNNCGNDGDHGCFESKGGG